MFDEDEAPDNVAKFLLLLDIARVDETDTLSLATESVEAPIFDEETFKDVKLLDDSLLPVAVDRFGEAALGFCVATTFSFSFRYEVIKS